MSARMTEIRPPEAGSQGDTMLETYFAAPKTLERLRAGPSGPYMDGFAASLKRDGYRAATAVRYLRAAAHLGHFLQSRGEAFDEDAWIFFIDARGGLHKEIISERFERWAAPPSLGVVGRIISVTQVGDAASV